MGRGGGLSVRHGAAVVHVRTVDEAAELVVKIGLQGRKGETNALEPFESTMRRAGRLLGLGRKASSEEVRRALARQGDSAHLDLAKRWTTARAGRRAAAHPDPDVYDDVIEVLQAIGTSTQQGETSDSMAAERDGSDSDGVSTIATFEERMEQRLDDIKELIMQVRADVLLRAEPIGKRDVQFFDIGDASGSEGAPAHEELDCLGSNLGAAASQLEKDESMKMEAEKVVESPAMQPLPAAFPEGVEGMTIQFESSDIGGLLASLEVGSLDSGFANQVDGDDMGSYKFPLGAGFHWQPKAKLPLDLAGTEAKLGLENYCYTIRNTVLDEKMQGLIEYGDKAKIEKAVQDALLWLTRPDTAGAFSYESKLKELEGFVGPIITTAMDNWKQAPSEVPTNQEDMNMSLGKSDTEAMTMSGVKVKESSEGELEDTLPPDAFDELSAFLEAASAALELAH
ncbi:unnamed protein product [Prorocentrum cordatum]|uniref:Uncharacterized protein n=1 Tax=Prorocentrum cordatum TaxID=2364126 RepID=A0ABN9R6S3_9DINO|nr:unnamed protein product [Polarella glacialis]